MSDPRPPTVRGPSDCAGCKMSAGGGSDCYVHGKQNPYPILTRRPPTEAELKEWRDVAGTSVQPYIETEYRLSSIVTDRLIDEIVRLRTLCGRARQHISDEAPSMHPIIQELDRAAKGEV